MMSNYPGFYFDGDCNDPSVQDQMKNDFWNFIRGPYFPPPFCMIKPDCTNDSVTIFCGDTSAPERRRKRRSVREVSIRYDYVKKFTDQESNDQAELKDYDAKNYNLGPVEAYCSEDGAVVRKCNEADLKCPEPPCKCSKNTGTITKCTRCPVGTFYDSHEDNCTLCAEGTYSPNEGALACDKCPEGTWTIGTRQENFTACAAKDNNNENQDGFHQPSIAWYGFDEVNDINLICDSIVIRKVLIGVVINKSSSCGFHGFSWNSMDLIPWNSIELHAASMELHLISMELHRTPYHGASMEPHGIPWSSHETPWNFHGIPWRSMEVHRNGQNSIEFH
ncbi:hypothetical protein OS493_033386 [Desmophyllum pertusum]|uniref:Tyrosine-protein kinase ephrin type A/B receptor-like domain-containing protein n=1 Tax=Desmophyllum pertusum TaxID=174260 RepID=A0A9W9YM88_9CNID|nr:hypothetical protein OS493_033386 [Desmophyllum pertusum]